MSVYMPIRAHGLKTRLLSKEVYEGLSSASSLNEIVTLLSVTEYGDFLERGEALSPRNYMEAFKRVFEKRINLIASIPSSESVRRFTLSILRGYDIENIIRVLRSMRAGKKFEEISNKLLKINFSKVDYEQLYQIRSIDNAIEYLRSRGYDISGHAFEMYKKYDSLLPIESDLKRIYYSNLIRSMRALPLSEGFAMERVFRMEVDFENMFLVMAPFLYDYSPELVESLLLPYTLRIPLSSFKKAVNVKNAREFVNMFPQYSSLVELLAKKNEFLAEIEKRNIINNHLESLKTAYSMGLPYVLYITKKFEYEFYNLTFILYQVYFKGNKEETMKLIIDA